MYAFQAHVTYIFWLALNVAEEGVRPNVGKTQECQLAMRTKMEKGVTKLEADKADGRDYASGMRVGEETDNVEGEEPAKKKAPPRRNNPTLTSAQMSCRCGALDHQCVTSKLCPWKGLSKVERLTNYEKRMNEVRRLEKMESKASAMSQPCTELTMNGIVHDCTIATTTAPIGTEPTRVIVHNTGKSLL
jgi:hypothetical protein